MSTLQGPWKSGQWWRGMCEAVETHMREGSSQDPLFRRLAEQLHTDRQVEFNSPLPAVAMSGNWWSSSWAWGWSGWNQQYWYQAWQNCLGRPQAHLTGLPDASAIRLPFKFHTDIP
eukprot:6227001-Amphidinium_carterae.3